MMTDSILGRRAAQRPQTWAAGKRDAPGLLVMTRPRLGDLGMNCRNPEGSFSFWLARSELNAGPRTFLGILSLLYFDEQSGFLVRMVRYAEIPLGRNPTQMYYADYRNTGGMKIPYRWTVARPGGPFTIQVDEVQQNVAIDDGKFTKPPAPREAQPAK